MKLLDKIANTLGYRPTHWADDVVIAFREAYLKNEKSFIVDSLFLRITYDVDQRARCVYCGHRGWHSEIVDHVKECSNKQKLLVKLKIKSYLKQKEA